MSIFDEQLAAIHCERCDLQNDHNLNIKFHSRKRHDGYIGESRSVHLCHDCFTNYSLCRFTAEEMYKYRP